MLTTIKQNMATALHERDGATIPEVIDVLATAALESLRKPDEDMKRVGSETLYRLTGWVIAYEDFGAAFTAAVEQAAKP